MKKIATKTASAIILMGASFILSNNGTANPPLDSAQSATSEISKAESILDMSKIECSVEFSTKQQEDLDKDLSKAELTGQLLNTEVDSSGQVLAEGTMNISYQVSSVDFKGIGLLPFKALVVLENEKVSKLLLISEDTRSTTRIFHGVIDMAANAGLSTISVMVEDKILDFSTNCEEKLPSSAVAQVK